MADGVLREAAGPTADSGECGGWFWQRAQEGAELGEGGGGDFGVGGVGEVFGRAGAEERAEDAGACGGAMGKFLVDEGGGEELGGR